MNSPPFPFDLLLAGWIASAVLMACLWFWHLRSGNAGVVDVGWALSLAVMAVAYGVLGNGYPVRRLLVSGMMALWGSRLALYLWRDRVRGRPEDARYTELRTAWQTNLPFRFFLFFQAQALIAALLSTPVALAVMDPWPTLRVTEWLAIGLWLVALVGESIADRQLELFKAEPSSRGRVCVVGLWRYSRHPNYFFEWLVWVAYALAATASPFGALAWACPALMLYLLFRVTGIPATEAHALRSRGEAYRSYQRTTSAFVPWFPREAR
ncbi:MAG: DUF1295 domain-containing protein [Vicinamibacterales bacterium]